MYVVILGKFKTLYMPTTLLYTLVLSYGGEAARCTRF